MYIEMVYFQQDTNVPKLNRFFNVQGLQAPVPQTVVKTHRWEVQEGGVHAVQKRVVH